MGRVEDILSHLEELYPDATIELNYSTGIELLVAVMLSAQSTDASVNKLTPSLFKTFKSVDDFADADLSELENAIRRIGLYKNKAKNIKKAAQVLREKYNGEIPNTSEALESLPGVGRKTANVVLSVWHGIPRIAVDTHVERVAKRLKLAYKKDSPLKVEEKLMRKVPKDKWSKVHHQFIFFGRYHCTARSPKCEGCPLKPWCRYPYINVK
ncbi:MAG: endonuclease III [Bacillota bacterium]